MLFAHWGGGSVQAQVDVTATYLKNAGFENGNTDGTKTGKGYLAPADWTAPDMPTSGTRNFGAQTMDATGDTHPGTFGVAVTPAEGDVYYFGRHSWASALNLKFSQETQVALPAGKYVLVASYKQASRNNDSNQDTGGTLKLDVSQNGVSIGSASTSTSSEPANYSTYFNTTAWSSVAAPFTVTEEGKATVSFIMDFNPNAKNTAQEAFAVDNIRILDLSKVDADNPIDVSGFVKNQNFDLSKNAWTTTTGAQNSALATNQAGAFTGRFWENWNGTSYIGKMYQTLDGVPNGTYQLTMAAFANTVNENNDHIAVYANAEKTFLTSTTPSNYNVLVYVTDNKLEIGLEQYTAVANWLGIDNIALIYYGEANVVNDLKFGVLKTAYDEAKATAEALLVNEEYVNITGSERTALQTAVDADVVASEEGYTTAAKNILNASNTFTNALAAYDGFVAAKTFSPDMAYATELTKQEVTTKQAVTLSASATATDAELATTNIYVALRAALESHAKAEIVEGATEIILGAWTNEVGTKEGEGWTNADGTTYDGKYNDNWSASSWTNDQNQWVKLPAGTYLLSVMARASKNNLNAFQLYANKERVDMPAEGSSGQVFGAGWNLNTLEFILSEEQFVNIGIWVDAKKEWAGYQNFRLMQLNSTATPALASGDDVTNLFIKNPSFELGNYNGWAASPSSDTRVAPNSNTTYTTAGVDGNYLFNVWDGSVKAHELDQTISLPAGVYVISAQTAYNFDSDKSSETAVLFAGSSLTNIDSHVKEQFVQSAVQFTVSETSDVKIGVKRNGWFKADNFHLYYFDNESDAAAKRAELLPAVVLDQAEPLVISQDAKSVTLNRPLVEGWNSLVVPFNMSEEELAIHKLTAYEYAGTEVVNGKLNANFNVATSIEANKPYIVKATAAKENIRLEGNIAIVASTELTTEDANGVFDFVGLYTKQETSPIAAGDYIVLSEGIKKTAGKNPIKAFRAYLKNVEPTETRALLFNVEGEGTLTGLDAVEFERAFLGDEAYDLSGRRVNKNAKGIVISNGKKMVIK